MSGQCEARFRHHYCGCHALGDLIVVWSLDVPCDCSGCTAEPDGSDS